MNPHAQHEILDALKAGQLEILERASGFGPEAFFAGSATQWGPAQHLGHLSLTHQRIAQGFGLRTQLPAHDMPSRSHAAVIETYQQALEQAKIAGFLRSNPFTAQITPESTQAELMESFAMGGKHLLEQIGTWQDAELDTRSMKHPLLGPLSAREMLFFCLHHDQHHLKALRRQA